MSKKRISAAIAGVALAGSLTLAPQAAAQTVVATDVTTTDSNLSGDIYTIPTNQGDQLLFVPDGNRRGFHDCWRP